jgi:hypothetical protein
MLLGLVAPACPVPSPACGRGAAVGSRCALPVACHGGGGGGWWRAVVVVVMVPDAGAVVGRGGDARCDDSA